MLIVHFAREQRQPALNERLGVCAGIQNGFQGDLLGDLMGVQNGGLNCAGKRELF
jgi:hypothetical protein